MLIARTECGTHSCAVFCKTYFINLTFYFTKNVGNKQFF